MEEILPGFRPPDFIIQRDNDPPRWLSATLAQCNRYNGPILYRSTRLVHNELWRERPYCLYRQVELLALDDPELALATKFYTTIDSTHFV